MENYKTQSTVHSMTQRGMIARNVLTGRINSELAIWNATEFHYDRGTIGVTTHMETQLVAYKQFRMVDVRHLPRSPLAYIRDTGAHPWLPTPPDDPEGVKLTLSRAASSYGVTLVLVSPRNCTSPQLLASEIPARRDHSATSTLSNRFKMTENWSTVSAHRPRRLVVHSCTVLNLHPPANYG